MFKRIFGKKKMEVNNNPNVVVMDIDVYRYFLESAQTVVSEYGGGKKLKVASKHVRRFNSAIQEEHIKKINTAKEAQRAVKKEAIRIQNNYKGKTLYIPRIVRDSLLIPIAAKAIEIYIPCKLYKEEGQMKLNCLDKDFDLLVKYDDDVSNFLFLLPLFKRTLRVSPYDLKTELPEGFIKILHHPMLGGVFVHKDTIL